MLIYINEIKSNAAEFSDKVIRIASSLKIDPNWLMQIMKFESNFSPSIKNPKSGAVGLIQFMPATAKSLGTTTDKLQAMSNVRQLDYVYQYFLPYKGKMKTFLDAYLAVFFPFAIGKSMNSTIESPDLSARAVSEANPIFDLNKDGKIKISEIYTAILKRIPESYKMFFRSPQNIAKAAATAVGFFFYLNF